MFVPRHPETALSSLKAGGGGENRKPMQFLSLLLNLFHDIPNKIDQPESNILEYIS